MHKTDRYYILKTFDLALQGEGLVAPNPMVGAVVYRDGQVLGMGYHEKHGSAHAEVNAIKNAELNGFSVEGATLYSNLEPCCHTQKITPPCTNLIVEKKIKRVVVSNLDPNPKVAGNGLKLLEEAGIETLSGVLKERGEKLNEVFFKHIVKRRPFICLKVAQTLDGKMVTETNSSQWITSEKSRERVHDLRFRYDAVMIGAGTANIDNPSLTVRNDKKIYGKQPKRIIVGNPLKINEEINLLNDEYKENTIILSNCGSYKNFGVEVLYPIIVEGMIDFDHAYELLYNEGITSILVEGGPKLITSIFNQKAFDKLTNFVAPKVIGNGRSFFESREIKNMSEALSLKNVSSRPIGEDIMWEGYL